MIRTEKMTERDAIQHEIDTYNELIPAAGELAATLLIEYAEPRERDAALARLVGLERHLWLKIGPQRIAARFDDRQMSAESISAVQFVRFSVEGVDAARFLELAGKGEVAVEVDHPSLAAWARSADCWPSRWRRIFASGCASVDAETRTPNPYSGFGVRRFVSFAWRVVTELGTPAG